MYPNKRYLTAILAILLFSCSKEKFIDGPGNLVPLTVDQNPGLPSILVKGAMLHSEAFGDPDTTMIVCLHGGPGHDYRYLLNCRELTNYGFKVVFYDQRGSGLSQRFSSQSYTQPGLTIVDTLCDELGGVIAHYRTSPRQKVFLLGQSWGAMLATAYAGKHPNAIQGMALFEPGGLKWDDVTSFIKRSRSMDLWSESLNDATYIDQFLTGKEDEQAVLDYKLSIIGATNAVTGEDFRAPGSLWRWGGVISSSLYKVGVKYKPDFSDGINRFTVPVFFAYSEKNQAYPDAWAQTISGAYPAASLFKVMGAGHTSMINDKKIWEEKTMPALVNYFKSH